MKLKEYQESVMRSQIDVPANVAAMRLTSGNGHLCNTIAQAWMQLPFVPESIAEHMGDMMRDAAIIAFTESIDIDSLIVDPATASDMSNELAAAVLGANPVALALMTSKFSGNIANAYATYFDQGHLDLTYLKHNLQLLVTTIALLSDLHDFSFESVLLNGSIKCLAQEFPEIYHDVDVTQSTRNLIVTE